MCCIGQQTAYWTLDLRFVGAGPIARALRSSQCGWKEVRLLLECMWVSCHSHRADPVHDQFAANTTQSGQLPLPTMLAIGDPTSPPLILPAKGKETLFLQTHQADQMTCYPPHLADQMHRATLVWKFYFTHYAATL